ncbi:acriflavin resistance protein [Ketogulonicigenium robustum]|uniref:Acriflavin resistance protein n=1 Tax=Ketogulonicigenium robustum TaxID=92947 RepID=A0A1W6NWY1_9RHOB|nr:efflux RND transporter permease subunit [Ketogulonicigenium robustum]ARO13701.1 acriflavin resistance protein [Ketogulonicigenium robustum]
MNRGFNLSEWALAHRSLIWFLMMVSLLAGVLSFLSLGREEDPSFTIKTAVISAAMPGASMEQTVDQVTDRIERKLQDLNGLDYTRSTTYPGLSVVFVELRPEVRGEDVRNAWRDMRNMMRDLTAEMPWEFQGFSFNDNFGDVFGSVYAFTGDGYTPRELHDTVDRVRSAVLTLDDTGKVDVIGAQDERVYIEFSSQRLAALGLDQNAVLETLNKQNAITPSGTITAGDERVFLRLGGQFTSAADVANVSLRVDDKYFRLSDVADVRAGYETPASFIFRLNGTPAVGLAIGMRDGANIQAFGAELDTLMARVAADLPVGIEMTRIADQPHVVEDAINHFVRALAEAVAIVLAVSFISLGVRAGLVVSLSIPLVLALTFVLMEYFGITLQRVSLGALIIALGLLVDDAMIAIETMISRLEQGETLTKAASYAWTSIAAPMLTGTLVTVAGFVPIGLNTSMAGEYTFSLFVVIAVSLTLSWMVAVLFAPLLGVALLPKKLKNAHKPAGVVRRTYHVALRFAMRARWLIIAMTVALFAVSAWGMRHIEQQFFPASDRTELIVDVTLPQNASIAATQSAVNEIEAFLADRDEVQFWSSYVGGPAPRFVLTLDLPTQAPYLAQIVIQTKDLTARDTLRTALDDFARKALPQAEVFSSLIALGPPVGKPVQYRLQGPDTGKLREIAREISGIMAADQRLTHIGLDWGEPARSVRLLLDQEKLRQFGMTQSDIADSLQTIFTGKTVTQMRDDIYLIDVVARGADDDRGSIERLQALQFGTSAGIAVPLATFATLEWAQEEPVILRRDTLPTITVKAGLVEGAQASTLVDSLAPQMQGVIDNLPAGYTLTVGGSVETSADSQAPIIAVVPIMLLAMLLLIMVQLQSFRLMFIVMATAPLAIIGVVAMMLPSHSPLGFVAILGILALIGILLRNAIILVHEIESDRASGLSRWDAVFKAADSRARPILLTAAAASLALIPISREIFWGPMAYAMMGGIIAGTLITLLFVPALYCIVFRVQPPEKVGAPQA